MVMMIRLIGTSVVSRLIADYSSHIVVTFTAPYQLLDEKGQVNTVSYRKKKK